MNMHICPECDNDLYPIKNLCTDRDRMREDQFCPECEIRYGLRSHGLELISKIKNPELLKAEARIQELETALRVITGLSKESQ